MHRLYLLRHGEARDGYPDAARELVVAGRQEVVATLQRAVARIEGTPSIYHSGLVRARQTAELAAAAFNAPEPQLLAGIHPGGEAELLFVEGLPGDNLLLVTHNPFVEDLVSYLTDEDVRIRTGSMVALQMEHWGRGCASLCWQLN